MKLLQYIERTGNRLPDPATLFLFGTVLVFILSSLLSYTGWQVPHPDGEMIQPFNLISSAGAWWLLSTLVDNFMAFPPLGIVLVGMLGMGLAEKTGFLPALLRFTVSYIPPSLLTPATLFLGITSSIALDAGYVVLVPIAAALYQSAGRSPLAGIAVAFAGVSAGFSANVFITALDPLLAGFTETGARIIDPEYRVAVTGNWWFMIASSVLLTVTGWFVTERIVSPNISRIDHKHAAEPVDALPGRQRQALKYACLATLLLLAVVILSTFIAGWPLHGRGERFDRWIEAMVPLLFILFFIPGLVYGWRAGTVKTDRDVAGMLGAVMAQLGPYIVLAFFAAQFIAAFGRSGLGQILAIRGGELLSQTGIPDPLLLSCFVVMVVLANLLVGSASAKYAFLAPVFVPMLMQVGISPELTQAAYRIGDSASNIITPMNPYMIIIIMEVRKYTSGSGLGTVVAMMLPYSGAFLLAWILLLTGWIQTGLPLGPGGDLYYPAF